jgi:hypothetical protein
MTAPLLDAHTLAQMRALQEANMPSTCDLIGYAETRAAGGSPKRTAVVIATTKCRLIVNAASLPIRGAQPEPTATFLLLLPATVDTTSAERAVVRGSTAGVAWEVALTLAGVEEPRSYSASRRLLANLAPLTTNVLEPIASVEVYEA